MRLRDLLHLVSGLKPLKAIQISGMERLPFVRLPVLYLHVEIKDVFVSTGATVTAPVSPDTALPESEI